MDWQMLKAAFNGGLEASGADLKDDERAVSFSLKAAIMLPIAIAVGALVAGIIVPIGIDELAGADTTNYSSGASTLWTNLDLFVVLAVLGLFVGYMMKTF